MKPSGKTATKRSSGKKGTSARSVTNEQGTHGVPRCGKCGAKTVRLEQLNQELLAVLAVHCLICGHHTFIGRPIVRLLRRPDIPDVIGKEAVMTER